MPCSSPSLGPTEVGYYNRYSMYQPKIHISIKCSFSLISKLRTELEVPNLVSLRERIATTRVTARPGGSRCPRSSEGSRRPRPGPGPMDHRRTRNSKIPSPRWRGRCSRPFHPPGSASGLRRATCSAASGAHFYPIRKIHVDKSNETISSKGNLTTWIPIANFLLSARRSRLNPKRG